MAQNERVLQMDQRMIDSKSVEGKPGDSSINLSDSERWISGIGGGALAAYGIRRGGIGGVGLAVLGGALIYRGATGHCQLYEQLKISSATDRGQSTIIRHGEGIKVEKSIFVNKEPADLYRFWYDVENLPLFMTHIESVRKIDERLSHWIARVKFGITIEWDAEVFNEIENELIAWRSVEGSKVPNAGSVRFDKAANGRGTELKVSVSYAPPGGAFGAAIAKLLGDDPARQLEEDLQRFKELMEQGEMPSSNSRLSDKRTKVESTAAGSL